MADGELHLAALGERGRTRPLRSRSIEPEFQASRAVRPCVPPKGARPWRVAVEPSTPEPQGEACDCAPLLDISIRALSFYCPPAKAKDVPWPDCSSTAVASERTRVGAIAVISSRARNNPAPIADLENVRLGALEQSPRPAHVTLLPQNGRESRCSGLSGRVFNAAREPRSPYLRFLRPGQGNTPSSPCLPKKTPCSAQKMPCSAAKNSLFSSLLILRHTPQMRRLSSSGDPGCGGGRASVAFRSGRIVLFSKAYDFLLFWRQNLC